MPEELLVVFVKAPRPGAVKTRLARSLGDAGAAAAYGRMVEVLLDQLASISTVELRFAPDEAEAEIAPWVRRAWTKQPQGQGTLGVRLQRAFAESFARGITRCVVIGSDCPTVTAPRIQTAWRALADHDLVLGPARDGGYWLIGLKQLHPLLFQDIQWSTGQVLAQTLAAARQLNLRVRQLECLTDVDTIEEWNQWLAGQDQVPG